MKPEVQRLLVLVGELTGITDPAELRKVQELAAILEDLASRKKKPIDKQAEKCRETPADQPPRVVIEVDGEPVDVKVGHVDR